MSVCLDSQSLIYAVATSDSQQHTLCTLSQVTYAHSVRRFSLSPKTSPVDHLYLPRPSDITNIRFSLSLAPLVPPFAPPSPAAQPFLMDCYLHVHVFGVEGMNFL